MKGPLTEDTTDGMQRVLNGKTETLPEVEVEVISDEEIQNILTRDEAGIISRPFSRRAEVAARVAIRLLTDSVSLAAAVILAYWVRFHYPVITRIFPPESQTDLMAVALTLAFTSPVLFFSLKSCGMYDTHIRIRVLDRIPKIVASVNAYLIFTLILTFLFDSQATPRGFLVFFWIFSICFLFLGRVFLQALMALLGVSDVVMRNTLIIGSGKVGKCVARKMVKHTGFGLRPIGFLDDDPLFAEFKEPELKDLRVLGGLDNLREVIDDFNVERVVIAFSGASSEKLLDIASTCNKLGVECSVVPRLFEIITDEVKVNEIGGVPLIRLREKKLRGYQTVLKTVEDYVLGTLLTLVALPILLITAVAIKLDSPGPVFFRHKRVGKNGKCFNCLKFRSMVDGAEKMQAELVKRNPDNEFGWLCWKEKEDPRVTRVGRWIRKFSIDELPQLFNVLAGQMSLVGPRPHIKEEVQQYKKWHRQRLNVKPGITGLWQVSGRSELPFDEMIKLDLYYIETWSLWQDVKILLRTVAAVLKTEGAC